MDLLLNNLVIVDGRGGDPVEGSIAVSRGRIAHAGPAADGPRTAARVIDGQGCTAIPGLIDTHTHITLDERDLVAPRLYNRDGESLGMLQAAARAGLALQNGITTLRDCNAPGYGTLALRSAFAQKLLPGPRLFCSGCAICATGGHMHAISYQADTPAQVVEGVRKQVEAGADFIKLVADGTTTAAAGTVQPHLGAEELKAGADAAHRAGKRVASHAVSREGVKRSLEAGADSIEHGYDLTDELVAMMLERNAWLVPTLSVHGAIVRNGGAAGWHADRLRNSERILGTAVASVGRAFRAGVRVACGSDAGSPFNPVWKVVPELRLLCEAGLAPGQALQAATLKAAELIGVQKDIGTLEAGKLADIVLVEGDPLRNVGALERIHAVIKEGAVVREPGARVNPRG